MIECFDRLKIQYAIAVPDSWSSKLIRKIADYSSTKVLLCATEVEAVTICSGLNLSGVLTILIMENSGIRSAGDVLARFELSHSIHNIFLISDRGGFGEANWWGAKHNCISDNMMKELNIVTRDVYSLSDFPSALETAIETFHNEQVSVALKLKKSFWDEMI